MMRTLWILFIAGQILNAGNMNYQQQNGYYELNPIYGKHPSANQIYKIKTLECIGLYGLTKALPRYKKHLLAGANMVVWGMIYYDNQSKGIALNFRW